MDENTEKRHLHIDFETYSEIDLRKVGVCKYAAHASTDILCMGYAFTGDKEAKVWIPGEPFSPDIIDHIYKDRLMYAWNASFEKCIWGAFYETHISYFLERLINIQNPEYPYILKNPKPRIYWRDTQAIALNWSLPMALGKCGEALNLDIQKDTRGSYLIQRLCKPQKITKNNPHKRFTPDTHPELFEELYSYCKQDVMAEMEIYKTIGYDLTKEEQHTWGLCFNKNLRGIHIDLKLVDRCIKLSERYLNEVKEKVPEITEGKIKTIGQVQAIIEWCTEQGYPMDNLQIGTVKTALKDPLLDEYPRVKDLLTLRYKAGGSAIKKFQKLKEASGEDGRIRDCFKYHKATTGREGGQSFQPQNLPRAKVKDVNKTIDDIMGKRYDEIVNLYPDFLDTMKAMIRPSVCASQGNKLIVSDYSSVENRILYWLAGQDDILQKIQEGVCLYSDMAATLYKKSYEDIESGSQERLHGKITVLGCGYGMGANAFKRTCSEAYGLEITDKTAKHTIDTFRSKYNKVVELWYGIDNAAKMACLNPGETHRFNRILFLYKDPFLYMILPNQKVLVYPYAKVEATQTPWGANTVSVTHMGGNSITRKWERKAVLPARFTENAAQAICREILMGAVKRTEAKGHDVVMTVHDEIVVETPKIDGLTIGELNEILCDAEDCYEGLPLKAEGFEAKRYRK